MSSSSHSYQSVELESGLSSHRRSQQVDDAPSPLRSNLLTILGIAAVVLLVGLVAYSQASVATTSSAVALHSTSAATSAMQVTALSEKEKEKKEEEDKPENICLAPDYTRVTMKLANEMTMVALFPDLLGNKKFEASDVIHVGHHYLVVFDNLYAIGRINEQLAFHSSEHQLINSSPARSGDSGFEAIVYDDVSDTYYVVIEAELQAADEFHPASLEDAGVKVKEGEGTHEAEFHALIEEVSFPAPGSDSKGYTLKDRCRSQFKFISGNKGFEGAVHVRLPSGEDGKPGELIMLGLCEGNFCEGGKRGREVGNGRIVMMRKRPATEDKECEWETVDLLALPSVAAFADYSAVAIRAIPGKEGKHSNTYRLVVSSQESSQIWVGELKISANPSLKDWSITDGLIYNFPRTNECDIEYCNIEGISLIDDNLLVAVSDKMKGGGRQHFRCLQKDQSIHSFVLP